MPTSANHLLNRFGAVHLAPASDRVQYQCCETREYSRALMPLIAIVQYLYPTKIQIIATLRQTLESRTACGLHKVVSINEVLSAIVQAVKYDACDRQFGSVQVLDAPSLLRLTQQFKGGHQIVFGTV